MDNGMPLEKALECGYQIPGMMWPAELGWLYETFSGSRSHAEVGVYAGKSLLVTAAGFMRSCEVTAVDNFSLGALGAEWLQAVSAATIERIHALTRARITLQIGSSLEVARQLAREGRRFDSVFLDGCHEYAECKADIEIWTMLIRPGGILAGHDYWPNHWGVMEAVQETGTFEVVPDTRIWFRHLPAATP
jgi:predicted O-methyltransferase YrrM